VSSVARSTFAARLPTPDLTGDKSLDDDLLADHRMVRFVLQKLLDRPQHTKHMYAELQARIEREDGVTIQVSSEMRMTACSTLAGVCVKDSAIVFQEVSEHTDVPVAALLNAKAANTDNIIQMLQNDVQLSGSFKMNARLLLNPIFKRFLAKRRDQCGHRNAALMTQNPIKQDNTINWYTCGAYSFAWNPQDFLIRVSHVSGEVKDVDPTLCPITRSFTLIDNFLDWGSHFKSPAGGQKIANHSFFKSDASGPYAGPKNMTAGGLECLALLDQVEQEYTDAQTAVANVLAANPVVAAAIQADAQRLQAAAKAVARTNRAKATVALETKAKRRHSAIG
jgi:hypothetical protein